MFDKRKNRLSIILYRYRDVIDYNNIKDLKLKQSVLSHLHGKIHMKKLYLDNAPLYFRINQSKLKPINGYKYKWELENQEEFIRESEWFKNEIYPLIIYDNAQDLIKETGICNKDIYYQLFGEDRSFNEFDLGQIYFIRFNENCCVPKILMFIFSYYGAVNLERIFQLVDKYYPVKYSKKDLQRKIVHQLYKWRRRGLLYNQGLKFSGKKKFFIDMLYGKII